MTPALHTTPRLSYAPANLARPHTRASLCVNPMHPGLLEWHLGPSSVHVSL